MVSLISYPFSVSKNLAELKANKISEKKPDKIWPKKDKDVNFIIRKAVLSGATANIKVSSIPDAAHINLSEMMFSNFGNEKGYKHYKDILKIILFDLYAKTENSRRQWCKKCGGHLMTDHPGMGLVDVYAAILPKLEFEPAVHVFYGERTVSVKDGLPKMKDLPSEMGGSGETLPE